jgi:hypothetical protein
MSGDGWASRLPSRGDLRCDAAVVSDGRLRAVRCCWTARAATTGWWTRGRWCRTAAAATAVRFQSVPYLVGAYTGGPGSAAFSVPDSSQAGTSYVYDGLGRIGTRPTT